MSPVRPNVTVVGRRFEAADYRLRDFLTRTAQPHRWIEAGTPESERALESVGLLDPPLPVVIEADQTTYVGATVESLAAAWTSVVLPTRTHYDLAIVGAGPAGLGAAVYAASYGLSRSCWSGTCLAVKPRTRR
jgi:thioredoxin reductase (NADPH)